MTTAPTFGDLYAFLFENINDKRSTDPYFLVRQFAAQHTIEVCFVIPILGAFGGHDDAEVLLNVFDRIPEHTVLGGPVESFLCSQPYSSFLVNALVAYATTIMKGRWDVAEKIILDSRQGMSDEEAVDRAYGVERYSAEVVKGRWAEGEPLLYACTHSMLQYAEHAVKGRLPAQLHNALVLGPHDDNVREYMEKYGKPGLEASRRCCSRLGNGKVCAVVRSNSRS